MQKVCFTSLALAVLCISVVICQNCEYQFELWTYYQDPTKFSYCNPNTNQSAIGSCLPGTAFVRNDTVTGCVPWTDWSDACVSKVNIAAITCEGETYLSPHAAEGPEIFYLCIGQNGTAVPLNCQEGRGFYAGGEYLGCFPWPIWRNLTGC